MCLLFCTLLTISLCCLSLQPALRLVMRYCRNALQECCLERKSDSLDTLNTDNGQMGSREREFIEFHLHQELDENKILVYKGLCPFHNFISALVRTKRGKKEKSVLQLFNGIFKTLPFLQLNKSMYTVFRIKLKAFNSTVLQDTHPLQSLFQRQSLKLWVVACVNSCFSLCLNIRCKTGWKF